jgi:colanic acid/amylovoran biosynthesis protein
VAPDFTNLVTGELPSDLAQFNNTVAIVPNQRMLDKSSPALAASYFEFMVGLGQRLSSLGYRIIVVVHETQLDARLAAELAKRIAGAVTLSDEDPRKLKGVLGACRCVISSRYHALVAALSQGVPAFGTSWSHKYPALFSDYEFRQGLLDTADLSNAIQVVTYDRSRCRMCHDGISPENVVALFELHYLRAAVKLAARDRDCGRQ